MKHGRIDNLDLLRLFAALSVVLFHYGFRGAAADNMSLVSFPALAPFAAYGYLGVNLFFVISGFVIAYSAFGRAPTTFAAARASRLYPGFVAGMSLTFVATLLWGAPRFSSDLSSFAANLTMFAPALGQPFMDGVYWSIVLEIIFYGWVAIFLFAGIFFSRQLGLIAGWLALSMLNEGWWQSGLLENLFITKFSGLFATGILLHRMVSGKRGLAEWLLLAAAIVYAVQAALIEVLWLEEHYAITYDHGLIALIVVAMIALFALALLAPRAPLPAGAIAALGGITYPLYLIHQQAGFIAFNRLADRVPPTLLLVGVSAAMMLAAWMIWRWIERPAIPRMRRLLLTLANYLPARLNRADGALAYSSAVSR